MAAKKSVAEQSPPETEAVYRFADGSLADERMRILAVCIASQQDAGFGAYLDVREAPCPDCGAPGFNSGWGTWRYACGAETHNGDGSPAEPCPRAATS